MSIRIGADIGGTFTDVVLVDDSGDGGQGFSIAKVLTTPPAPDDAVLEGIENVLEAAGAAPKTVTQVLHGTTLFANVIIERKGLRTALITTKGFRDAIEIGREHRYDLYDLRLRRPAPLAPRHLRFEVTERVLADGSVRTPLEDHEVEQLAERLRLEGVEAVAVCLLHAYLQPTHERRIGEILRAALPEVAVTLSSELVPEIREYDRTSTTLANVYVKPIAAGYLRRLQHRLEERGLAAGLHCMQSNGGWCDANAAAEFPIRLVESGPAAGALAAAHFGGLLGHRDLLSFDMGGTTAKACLIVDGEPQIAPDFELDRQYAFKKGSGLPVKVPVIEMIEIGTGGGSIARVDAMGRLRVGPESAGASPGPACYGQGGVQATVTDADLVLGYLDADFFLGGRLRLDRAAAERAILEHVGAPLELGLIEAAWGIHQLANESMASAARVHAIERGQEAAQLPIFAFGGAGPVHAYGVARTLRSPRVIYPMAAGVMSSIGFLLAPPSFECARSLPGPLEGLDWRRVDGMWAEMEAETRRVLCSSLGAGLGAGLDGNALALHRYADMRYVKQGYEIRVPLPAGVLDATREAEIEAAFERVYAARYGHLVAHAPLEVVSWRMVATGPPPPPWRRRAAPVASGNSHKGTRSAYLPERRGLCPLPVYDRYALREDTPITAPALIEERESTVVILGSAQVRVDGWGNLVVDLPAAAAAFPESRR